jgi:hypothetical protein
LELPHQYQAEEQVLRDIIPSWNEMEAEPTAKAPLLLFWEHNIMQLSVSMRLHRPTSSIFFIDSYCERILLLVGVSATLCGKK